MDKITPDEFFLARWIEGKLTDQELSDFKKTNAYKEFNYINEKSQLLKGPDVDTESALKKVRSKINTPKKQSKTVKMWFAVAASVALLISSYGVLNLKTTYSTGIGEKTTVVLADGSTIHLNSNSSLSHKKFFWKNNKIVNFNGEAYFTITKGKGFKVNTSKGQVAVLGTQFNIKDRDYCFEVNCYEGKVSYTQPNTQPIYLTKGQKVALNIQNNQVHKSLFSTPAPHWKNDISIYKNTLLSEVLSEFSQVYPVTFNTTHINLEQLYTGNFTHTNIDIALKTVFIPLNISYTKQADGIIILTKN